MLHYKAKLHSGHWWSRPPEPSQRSNARRVRSSHHTFTKENTDNCRKFQLNRKIYTVSENLGILLWARVQNKELASTSFNCAKFGLSGHFMLRFHTNFALIKVWTDSNFKVLKNRKWRWCLRLTAVEPEPNCFCPMKQLESTDLPRERGEIRNKGSYGEDPLRGPNSYPIIYYCNFYRNVPHRSKYVSIKASNFRKFCAVIFDKIFQPFFDI